MFALHGAHHSRTSCAFAELFSVGSLFESVFAEHSALRRVVALARATSGGILLVAVFAEHQRTGDRRAGIAFTNVASGRGIFLQAMLADDFAAFRGARFALADITAGACVLLEAVVARHRAVNVRPIARHCWRYWRKLLSFSAQSHHEEDKPRCGSRRKHRRHL